MLAFWCKYLHKLLRQNYLTKNYEFNNSSMMKPSWDTEIPRHFWYKYGYYPPPYFPGSKLWNSLRNKNLIKKLMSQEEKTSLKKFIFYEEETSVTKKLISYEEENLAKNWYLTKYHWKTRWIRMNMKTTIIIWQVFFIFKFKWCLWILASKLCVTLLQDLIICSCL